MKLIFDLANRAQSAVGFRAPACRCTSLLTPVIALSFFRIFAIF